MLSSPRTHLHRTTAAAGRPRRRSACVLGLAIGALFAAPAQAALSDTIHPFATLGYNYDDNLLRLDDKANTGGSRSDTTRQLQAGLLFERPIGRQVLSGQAKASRVSFDHYSQLNYNGKDLQGALEWHLGNHLAGHLGASYAQTLTPFTDFHTSDLNLRTTQRRNVDGAWTFHPSWRLRAGYVRDRFNYDLPSQRANDRTEEMREAGVDYLASSGSRIGLVARQFKGEYEHRRLIGGSAIDDGYIQDELKANVYWTLGGVTQVQLLAGWAKRKHNFFSVRDSSGLNGRVTAFWQPLGKLRLTAAAWREFGAIESAVVNSSQNKGASLAATYDISAKLRGEASLRRERRSYDGIAGVVLRGDNSDMLRAATAGLTYSPRNFLQVGVSAFHEVRTGSPLVGTGNYRASGMSLNVTTQF